MNSRFTPNSNTDNVIQLGAHMGGRIAPVNMENIVKVGNLNTSDKLYCQLHGYNYCFATLLTALPKSPLIGEVWETTMRPSFPHDSEFNRFCDSFTELFFHIKYKLFIEAAVVPEVFHRRPDLICDDAADKPLEHWLNGIVCALSMTKQVPELWVTNNTSEYGELLLTAMTKTINEFCDRHGINKQFAVDIVFDKFQVLVDRQYLATQK